MPLEQSSRPVFDLLEGEDPVLPILQASIAGDVAAVKSLLSQAPLNEIVLQKAAFVHYESRKRENEDDIRTVSVCSFSHLERVLIKAAVAGQAATVSVLIKYAAQHRLSPWLYHPIKAAIEQDDLAMIDALFAAYPSAVYCDFGPGDHRPLEYAVKRRRANTVKLLLDKGAAQCSLDPVYDSAKSYQDHLLRLATTGRYANKATAEVLSEHFSPAV
ncbi:hypothetical protein CC79DRAFT_1337642 [Sarocladium strictum]